jgi:hypothetical protein
MATAFQRSVVQYTVDLVDYGSTGSVESNAGHGNISGSLVT